jgi:hypothetical protein
MINSMLGVKTDADLHKDIRVTITTIDATADCIPMLFVEAVKNKMARA